VNWADPLGLEKSLLDKTKDVLQDTLDDMGDSLNKWLDNASYWLDKLEDGAYNTLIVVWWKLVIEWTVSFANWVPICTAAWISVAMTAWSDFAVAGSVCLATMGPWALSLWAGGIMMAVWEAGKEAKDRRRPSKDLSDKIRERDGNKCIYCGKKTNTDKTSNPDKSEIDHKKPWSKWWKTDEDNLQNTCRTCNRKKATNTDPDFRAENWY